MKTVDTLNEYFGGYAAAVAQSRALISVEDGLKPSFRAILYANYTDKFVYPNKTAKFTKITGSAVRFYWHGDGALYEQMIRSSKPYVMNVPFYDIQGSSGGMTSSTSHSAPRYVEGRLSEPITQLFRFIDDDVVTEWFDNYDNTEKSPALLPSIGYWAFINGSMGIGAGISSTIPAFNLREMNEALANKLLGKPYKQPLPDFPTGGILVNAGAVAESLSKGTGESCRLRAKTQFILENGLDVILVTELPYGVYSNTICEELEVLIRDEEVDWGIDHYHDGTGLNPKIEITLKEGVNKAEALNKLFAKTSLQSTYGINLTMLENNRYPKVFTLDEAMEAHLNHEKLMYTRAFTNKRAKCLLDLELVEGLLLIQPVIEEVVKVIRESSNRNAATEALKENFLLTERQAREVLKLPLGRINKLDVSKLEEQKGVLLKEIAYYDEALADEAVLHKIMADELLRVAKQFGNDRKTLIEDLPEGEDALKLIYILENGKATTSASYKGPYVATIVEGNEYFLLTKNGVVYRSNEAPKRQKYIARLDDGDKVIAAYPFTDSYFLSFTDPEKHFRCKQLSTFNKGKTTLSLSPIKTHHYGEERLSSKDAKKLH